MRAAIVLAAGRSRRFGATDKLLAALHGKPLLRHAIDRARGGGGGRLLVVTSSARTARLVRGVRDVVAVRARDADAGLSASLKAGLAALRPIEREVLVFLGDMPFAAVPRTMRVRAGSNGARPVWRGAPGHPLLVRVAGRAGGGSARRSGARRDGRHRERAGAGAGKLVDIDSPAALRRARIAASSPGVERGMREVA